MPKESAQFSAILPHAFTSQKVVSTLSQVPSGFLLDLDVTTVNIANALRIITSPNSSRETRISAQKMIEHNQNEMISLENSPLLAFKRRFDEILTEEKHVVRLGQFEELKSLIESGAIPANLEQLRNYLIEIDEGIFGFVPDPEEL